MQQELVRRLFGARFAFRHPSHLFIDVARILGRPNNASLSTFEHVGDWLSAAQGGQGSVSKSPPSFDNPTAIREVCQTEQIRNDMSCKFLAGSRSWEGCGRALLSFGDQTLQFLPYSVAFFANYDTAARRHHGHPFQLVVC